MSPKIFNFIGLLVTLVGAITLAFGLIIPGKRAMQAGAPRMGAESEKENLLLPQLRDRMRESRHALIGIIIMAVGFLLQIIGNWPGF